MIRKRPAAKGNEPVQHRIRARRSKRSVVTPHAPRYRDLTLVVQSGVRQFPSTDRTASPTGSPNRTPYCWEDVTRGTIRISLEPLHEGEYLLRLWSIASSVSARRSSHMSAFPSASMAPMKATAGWTPEPSRADSREQKTPSCREIQAECDTESSCLSHLEQISASKM